MIQMDGYISCGLFQRIQWAFEDMFINIVFNDVLKTDNFSDTFVNTFLVPLHKEIHKLSSIGDVFRWLEQNHKWWFDEYVPNWDRLIRRLHDVNRTNEDVVAASKEYDQKLEKEIDKALDPEQFASGWEGSWI